MAEMKDMYKLACYIDASLAARVSTKGSSNPAALAYPVAEGYLSRHKWIPKRFMTEKKKLAVSNILMNALNHGYIEVTGNAETGYYLDLTRRPNGGSHLIAKKFYLIPVGLIDESLKRYDKTQTVFIVVLAAIIGAVGKAVFDQAVAAFTTGK